MLYTLLKPIVYVAVRLWFRRIYFAGEQHIPSDKPVLLACNHPLSFMDGVVLAVLLKRRLFFLTRSDVFRKWWSNYLLRTLNLVPIYREQEAKKELHKNIDTFKECFDVFDKKGMVLIFSEGKCVMEKRMRPLKKGTARLALLAAEKDNFETDLQIVPCGINYTYPEKYFSELIIEIGKPIAVKDYEAMWRQSSPKAMNTLTQDISDRLKKLVIHIEQPTAETIAENVLQQMRHLFVNDTSLIRTSDRFTAEKKITDEINLQSDVATTQVSVNLLPNKTNNIPVSILISIGYVLNAIPWLIAKRIAQKRVTHIEFYSPVLLSVMMTCWLIYFLCITIVAIAAVGWKGCWISCIVALMGLVSVYLVKRSNAIPTHKVLINQ